MLTGMEVRIVVGIGTIVWQGITKALTFMALTFYANQYFDSQQNQSSLLSLLTRLK